MTPKLCSGGELKRL